MASTTLKLPPGLKSRVATLAKKSGRSAHSLMLEAIERHAAREERTREFVREALAADRAIDLAHEVDAVFSDLRPARVERDVVAPSGDSVRQ